VQHRHLKKRDLPVRLRHNNLIGGGTSIHCPQATLSGEYQIKAFLQTRRSQAEISDALNRSERTLSREIRRNSFEGEYDRCLQKDGKREKGGRRKETGEQKKQDDKIRRAYLRCPFSGLIFTSAGGGRIGKIVRLTENSEHSPP